MHDCLPHLETYRFPSIQRGELDTLQINIGLKCNQQCVHCHVNASPKRTEMMTDETIAFVKGYLDQKPLEMLDITGGAPELHPRFKDLVRYARDRSVHVMDRCNLTVLLEPGMEDMAGFLAEQQVEIVASLPCYSAANVDQQRGTGVFDSSIRALQVLNELGYGAVDGDLKLNLVYNPQGPTLPPSQQQLEQDYKQQLQEHFGIVFNELYTLCNMPIRRFGSMLISNGKMQDYLELLHTAHRDDNLDNVMCRHLLSIDWQGYVYDCDFNQMLGLNFSDNETPVHLSELLVDDINGRSIAVRSHCYGCTAGQGSSCGGALA